jgi:hypothetical protein
VLIDVVSTPFTLTISDYFSMGYERYKEDRVFFMGVNPFEPSKLLGSVRC